MKRHLKIVIAFCVFLGCGRSLGFWMPWATPLMMPYSSFYNSPFVLPQMSMQCNPMFGFCPNPYAFLNTHPYFGLGGGFSNYVGLSSSSYIGNSDINRYFNDRLSSGLSDSSSSLYRGNSTGSQGLTPGLSSGQNTRPAAPRARAQSPPVQQEDDDDGAQAAIDQAKRVLPKVELDPNGNIYEFCPDCVAKRDTDAAPETSGGPFQYKRCEPPQRNIATANLPASGPAKEQLLEYQSRPASGPMARCIFESQVQASAGLMVYCDNNTYRRDPSAKCVPKELHRMIAHAYEDITKCVGVDGKKLFAMIAQESRFMPNMKFYNGFDETKATAHGIGQYVESTLIGTTNNHSHYINRVQQGSENNAVKANCERVKKIYGPIPTDGGHNKLVCQSTSVPQHMLSNMFNAVIDHLRFKEAQAHALMGRVPTVAIPAMAEILAFLDHHDGPARAKQKREVYLKYLEEQGVRNVGNLLEHFRKYLTGPALTYDRQGGKDHDQISSLRKTSETMAAHMDKNFPGVKCD